MEYWDKFDKALKQYLNSEAGQKKISRINKKLNKWTKAEIEDIKKMGENIKNGEYKLE